MISVTSLLKSKYIPRYIESRFFKIHKSLKTFSELVRTCLQVLVVYLLLFFYLAHQIQQPISELLPCKKTIRWQSSYMYSEKATKFLEILTLLLSTVHTDKSKVKISKKFVAFSEYMNFKNSEIGSWIW